MNERKWTEDQKNAIGAGDCSIAVSAAAGSGKTSVMTQRIVDRICSGKTDISRMLIVTFTRAASAELSSRIEDLLTDKSAENPSDRRIARQLLLLPSAKIDTIDGFCLDLIRENFSDTGVSGFAVIDAETEEILENEVMDALVSDYFDGNIAEYARISDFDGFADTFGSPSSDTLLSETAVRVHRFYESVPDRKKVMIGGASNGGDFSLSVWGRAIYKFAEGLFTHYEKLFSEASAVISASEGAQGWLDGFLADGRYCSLMLGKLRSGAPYKEIRALITDFASYRVKRLGAVKAENKSAELERFGKCRVRFKGEVESLGSSFFPCEEKEIIRAAMITSDMQEKLECFLSEYDRRLSEEKKRRRVMSFSDIERLALQLLTDREHNCKSEAAKEISERYDEIYIDEYQDTNEIQDMIFSLISRGNNVFTVGDVKQSIYEFRGAEPTIFIKQIEEREKYRKDGNQKKAKIFLSENFRSSCEIIAAVNGVFDVLMNTGGELCYGEDERLKAGKCDFHGPLPELDIICRDEETGSGEENYVAERINELIRTGEAKPGGIAVLLPTRAKARRVEEALSKLCIPCKNATSSEFFSNPEVLLALSLLNTVDNPDRDVYLAGTLESPIYGVSMSELIYIRKYKKTGSLFSALKAFTADTGFAKGEKFLSDHERFREYAGTSTCGGLVRKIYGETQIMSLCAAGGSVGQVESARANLRRLYDYARSFEKSGRGGLYEFISFMSGLVERDSSTDTAKFAPSSGAVTVTTVHKSKGLEYDVCFLCDMAREFNRTDAGDSVVAERALPLAMKLFDGDVRRDTPMRAAAISDARDRKTDELLRELYVAMTRAKRRLIITGEVKNPEDALKYDFRDAGSECAFAARFFTAHAKYGSKSYLDLLTLALSKHPELCGFYIASGHVLPEKRTEKTESSDKMTYYEAKKLTETRLGFVYPFKVLSHVPSKLSVSKLYPDVLDDTRDATKTEENEEESFAAPVFISGEEKAGAADRGTAMHMFMQFFDFDSVEKLGVSGEIKRLTENKFLFPGDADKLNRRKLEKFFSSPLAAEMKGASRIYREKRFIINYPAENFSEDTQMQAALAGEKLLVQGVIDCAFVGDDGGLVLVDYKTDSFPAGTDRQIIEETLKKRHMRQLGYYRYACEKLFDMPLSHTYIYSFALDGTIEL